MSVSVTGGVGEVKRYWPGKAPEWEWGAEADEEFDIRSACLIKSLAQLAFPPVGNSDEDALEEKRRRIREKLLQRQQELELKEEWEEESEYETDSEDDDVGGVALAKPVFVPKSYIIEERERVVAEERALSEAVRRRMEERKLETKQIVVEKIREEQEMAVEEDEANTDDDDDDDDNDKMNEGEEYERWKEREIGRIKKDREDREAIERREWERKIPKQLQPSSTAASPKHKQKHKYYHYHNHNHKGAFFQEDADR